MDIADFHGLMTINGVDPYVLYRVWLFDKMGEHSNINALLKPAPIKVNNPINFREVPGRQYPTDLKPITDEREFTLNFACHGDNDADFILNYFNFITFLKSGATNTGWLTIQLANIPSLSFKCFVKSPDSYDSKTYMDEKDIVVGTFKVIFTEPEPNF